MAGHSCAGRAPDDFPRFGRLKLVAEVNPYHISDDMRWMEERIGHARSRGAYAFRKLKDAGAVTDLRQRQSGHQRCPLLLESGVWPLRGGHPSDVEGRTEGWLVSRPASDDRGGVGGLHQSAGVGFVRRGQQGDDRRWEAGGFRRLRHRSRSCRTVGTRQVARSASAVHGRGWPRRLRSRSLYCTVAQTAHARICTPVRPPGELLR